MGSKGCYKVAARETLWRSTWIWKWALPVCFTSLLVIWTHFKSCTACLNWEIKSFFIHMCIHFPYEFNLIFSGFYSVISPPLTKLGSYFLKNIISWPCHLSRTPANLLMSICFVIWWPRSVLLNWVVNGSVCVCVLFFVHLARLYLYKRPQVHRIILFEFLYRYL